MSPDQKLSPVQRRRGVVIYPVWSQRQSRGRGRKNEECRGCESSAGGSATCESLRRPTYIIFRPNSHKPVKPKHRPHPRPAFSACPLCHRTHLPFVPRHLVVVVVHNNTCDLQPRPCSVSPARANQRPPVPQQRSMQFIVTARRLSRRPPASVPIILHIHDSFSYETRQPSRALEDGARQAWSWPWPTAHARLPASIPRFSGYPSLLVWVGWRHVSPLTHKPLVRLSAPKRKGQCDPS